MSAKCQAMHVTTTKRKVGDHVYECHLLRHSYRENGKVKHRTLANLSSLPDEALALLRAYLRGDAVGPLDQAFTILRSLPHGHADAVVGMLRKLGSTSSSPLGRALGRREAQGQPQTDDRGPAPAQLPDAAHRSRDPDAQPLRAAASGPGARVHDALDPHAAAATRARTAPAFIRPVATSPQASSRRNPRGTMAQAHVSRRTWG